MAAYQFPNNIEGEHSSIERYPVRHAATPRRKLCPDRLLIILQYDESNPGWECFHCREKGSTKSTVLAWLLDVHHPIDQTAAENGATIVGAMGRVKR